MRADITTALREVVAADDSNPFNKRDRVFAAALLEIRASLAKLELAVQLLQKGENS